MSGELISNKHLPKSVNEPYSHDQYVSVIRYPATRRMIFTRKGSYYLSFPSVCFSITYYKAAGKLHFRHFRVAFTSNAKTVKNIYYPQFPNMYTDLHFCMGRGFPPFKDLDSLIDTLVKRFWASRFSSVFYDNIGGGIFADFNQWQKKTKTKPDWVPTTREMRKVVNNEILKTFNLDKKYKY